MNIPTDLRHSNLISRIPRPARYLKSQSSQLSRSITEPIKERVARSRVSRGVLGHQESIKEGHRTSRNITESHKNHKAPGAQNNHGHEPRHPASQYGTKRHGVTGRLNSAMECHGGWRLHDFRQGHNVKQSQDETGDTGAP